LRKKTPEVGRLRPGTIAKPPVFKRLLGLWLIAVVAAMAVMPIDSRWGLSLLWGFSVCLLPGVSFAWYAFRYQGAHRVASAVQMFYRAEAVKFFLTACLFAAVFQHADKINLLVFFLAFIAAQIASWLLAAMTIKNQSR
jgi:ATP synthase protein I